MPIIKPRGYLSAAILRDAGDVQLKPNPARTRVTVEADQAIRYVELTDMAGRTMIVQKYDGGTLSATLDINALPHGLYMVKVRTEKAVTTKKLLIE
ncbi:MAG: T9SS type A sorting domain-containing protein [Bacteroidales bacterium]|nr:T9SS type A sorting domain-containing protein [Bacteroidales bacterium]